MTARQGRIAFLLEHYRDVLAGLWDARSGGDGLPIMCSVWRSPPYQEIERLLPILRTAQPKAWRALMASYVLPTLPARRAVCPRCHRLAPAEAIGQPCSHGGRVRKPVVMVPHIQRQPAYAVDGRWITVGIAWLDRHWIGDPSIPADLLPLVGVA